MPVLLLRIAGLPAAAQEKAGLPAWGATQSVTHRYIQRRNQPLPMKTPPLTLAFALLAVLLGVTACNPAQPATSDAASTAHVPEYDSLLAAELGADERGMRTYVMAFLRAGPNRDTTRVREVQRAHLDNIRRLAEEGTLLVAGPFLDDGPIRGIYIFDVTTLEEARVLTETDPAIQAGRLEMELHPWYGPAALRGLDEIHERITRTAP